MQPKHPLQSKVILTLNAGSSSLKFALFNANDTLIRALSGKFERIGLDNALLSFTQGSQSPIEMPVEAGTHQACIKPLLALLKVNAGVENIDVIGHRIVHGGMHYSQPAHVTDKMLQDLRGISLFDPEHMPAALGLIEGCTRQFSGVPQVACFDTAFHQTLPNVSSMFPLPRMFHAKGVRRYGFHGLSYAYVMQELAHVGGHASANGRVVLAHLGNGASMAAVINGKSMDTSMAFTPAAGLPMSTRSGDLDPGLFAYFSKSEGMTHEQFHDMVNKRSGLLGISETSPDVRDLLACEATDKRAAEALEIFCYHAKKGIGAFAAALGGIDTLVFTGGIGENAPLIRARICAGLQFMGIDLDSELNAANFDVISKANQSVLVRVIRTDEEMQIARMVIPFTDAAAPVGISILAAPVATDGLAFGVTTPDKTTNNEKSPVE